MLESDKLILASPRPPSSSPFVIAPFIPLPASPRTHLLSFPGKLAGSVFESPQSTEPKSAHASEAKFSGPGPSHTVTTQDGSPQGVHVCDPHRVRDLAPRAAQLALQPHGHPAQAGRQPPRLD